MYERKSAQLTTQVKELQYPPTYILVRMIHTKVNALDSLECGVLVKPSVLSQPVVIK